MKTNFDVYKEELELSQCGTDFGVNKTTQIPRDCGKMSCSSCLFNKAGYTCGQYRLKWLGTEYKEFIELSAEEKALLEEIKTTYSKVQRKDCFLFFGTVHKNCTTYMPKDYIALNLFKKTLFSNLKEEKTYSIKDLLEGKEQE